MAAGIASDVDFEKVDFDSLANAKYYINKGAYGTVFGPFTLKNKASALKQIFIEPSTANVFKSKVDLKKSIWTSWKHKNLIEIFHVSVMDNAVYLLMEYASGGSLRRLLDNSGASVYCKRNVTNWAKQIADGMLYLHARDIVHRDLKSSNSKCVIHVLVSKLELQLMRYFT